MYIHMYTHLFRSSQVEAPTRHIYKYMCVHVYMCICVYVCMYVYMSICVHSYTYICVYVYMSICIRIWMKKNEKYICVYVYMSICIDVYVCVCKHTSSARRRLAAPAQHSASWLSTSLLACLNFENWFILQFLGGQCPSIFILCKAVKDFSVCFSDFVFCLSCLCNLS